MSEILIKAEGLSKKFCRSLKRGMVYGTTDSFKSMLGIKTNLEVLRKGEFWAINNISFELKRGETLGIIGMNGSGKSTLLRLLNGIFPPDCGRISVNGKIGALIAVGAGFHPHMTGRENIYLNGTILGMGREEIAQKFESIVDFAEIGDFLNAPVSTYSSGMTVRLGFSIAIHCEPDILLVDEILSVGDLSFRNKSLRRMDEFRQKAKGIIFISHNLEQVRVLCDRVLVMDKGQFIFSGETADGILFYEEYINRQKVAHEHNANKKDWVREHLSSNQEIEVREIGVSGQNENSVAMGSPLDVFCKFTVKQWLSNLYFSVSISNSENRNCIWVMSNDCPGTSFENLHPGKYAMKLQIAQHHLVAGVYFLNIGIRNNQTGETYERIYSNYSFRVSNDAERPPRAIISVEDNWKLEQEG
jgi:lipopolysaccharide transport system ATP-binding protein